jgi:cell division septation protein DedD
MLRLVILSLCLVGASASAANQYSLPARTLSLPSNADFPATYEISAELRRQNITLSGDNARVAQVDLRIRGGTPGATVGLFLGRGVVDSVVLADSSERTITLTNKDAKSLVPWIILVRKGEMQILEMRVTLDKGDTVAAPAPIPAPAPSLVPPVEEPKPAPTPAPVVPTPAKPVEAPKPAPAPVVKPTPAPPAPAPAPTPAPLPVPPAATSSRWIIGQGLYYVEGTASRALPGQVTTILGNGSMVVRLNRGQQFIIREDSGRLAQITNKCVRNLCPGDSVVSFDSLGRPQTVSIITFQSSETAVVRAQQTGELIGNWPVYSLKKR